MISVEQKGNFEKTEKFLKKSFGNKWKEILEKYGRLGVEYLSAATPIDTGLTASSWEYEIIQNKSGLSIVWNNLNVVDNGKYKLNIALLLQYGHATKNGGWVEGIDYINPALKPIFTKMADLAWKEVSSTV